MVSKSSEISYECKNHMPTILVSQMFGVYPFNLNNHRMTIKSSLTMLLFTAYVIVYIAIFATLKIHVTKLSTRIKFVLLIFFVIENISILFGFVINRNNIKMYWEKIKKAEFLIVKSNLLENKIVIDKKEIIKILVLSIISSVHFTGSKLSNMFITLCTMRIGLLQMIFINLAKDIHGKLERLNWALSDYTCRFPSFLIPPADPGNPFREFSCVVKNRREKLRQFKWSSSADITQDNVRTLNELHKCLTDATNALSSIFGLPLLCCITFVTVGTAVTVCFTAVILIYSEDIQNETLNYVYLFGPFIKHSLVLWFVIITVKISDDIKSEVSFSKIKFIFNIFLLTFYFSYLHLNVDAQYSE